MEILEKIKSLNLPEAEYVVMGSAILEVKGIRKAEDIDIIVTKRLFSELKDSGEWTYKVKKGSLGGVEVESLKNNEGSVTLYHHIYGGGTIDYFLDDPTTETVDGIKFASLENLLKVKGSGKSWNRTKDQEDARLIEEYLANSK